MKKQQDLFNTNLPSIVTRVINEATNKLLVSGCAFKVVLPNGEVQEHDPNNWLNPEKKLTRQRKDRPYGTLCNYYRPYVENMQVGEVVVIPRREFTFVELQSAVTAWCGHHYGNGSVTSSKNVSNDTLELMRLK